MQRLLFLFFFFPFVFLTQQGSAVDILVNWAVPLKKEFASVKKRELAGVLYHDGVIVAALRNGHMAAFDRAGRKVGERRFNGSFTVPPLVVGDGILAGESNTVHFLAMDLSDRWVVHGKSPLVAQPLLRPEGIYLQFTENTVYLVDPLTGFLRANYTFYGETPLSYAILATPVSYGEKVAFGFSNGQIIFFIHRVAEREGVEEIIPYNKYHTGSSHSSFFDERNFFDVFSFLPSSEGMFFFSNGEKSGLLRLSDGAIHTFEGSLRNLRFEQFGNGEIVGYGEGGVWIFTRDGLVKRTVMRTGSFVSNYIPAGRYIFLTETSGTITIYDPTLTFPLASICVPHGISGHAEWAEGALYFISDMGVLYSLSVMEQRRVQKILAKEGKTGNKSADLLEK